MEHEHRIRKCKIQHGTYVGDVSHGVRLRSGARELQLVLV